MKSGKLSVLGITILFGFISTVDAVTAWTMRGKPGDEDVSLEPSQIEGSRSFLDIIGVVNSYLRFAIGFVCFLFMVWNGFQLIMSRGNEKDMKAAKDALIGCGMGLASCILAYIIVNIAINLFR